MPVQFCRLSYSFVFAFVGALCSFACGDDGRSSELGAAQTAQPDAPIRTAKPSARVGLVLSFDAATFCTKCVDLGGAVRVSGEALLDRARIAVKKQVFGSAQRADVSVLGHLGLPVVSRKANLSGLGAAICKLGTAIGGRTIEAGCDYPDESCFCETESGGTGEYWAYFNQDASDTGWKGAGVGPSGRILENGDIDGWSWTGFNSTFEPDRAPPPITLDQICASPPTNPCLHVVYLPTVIR